jgi:hypothetical protein
VGNGNLEGRVGERVTLRLFIGKLVVRMVAAQDRVQWGILELALLRRRVTYTRLERLRGDIHTNEAHKNNNTTPTFRGLHKTTQKHGRWRKKR